MKTRQTRWRTLRRVAIPTAIVLALTGVVVPVNTAQAAASSEMTVMDWNIGGGTCATGPRGTTDFGHAVDEIKRRRDAGVTVFALQEVFRSQVSTILAKLGYNETDHHQFARTITCDNGGDKGNAIISAYPIIDRDNHTYPESMQEDGDDKRNVIAASFRVDGRKVWVFDTHLTSLGGPDTGPAAKRAAQASEARIWAETFNTFPFRSIVAGDFNDTPAATERDAHARMKVLYVDTWQESHPPDGSGGFTLPATAPDRRVDYIWRRKGAKLSLMSESVTSQGLYRLSDHLAVIAHFDVLAA